MNAMQLVILTKVALSIALVLVVRLAVTAPCNWGNFPRVCDDDEVCGWNCWTLEIHTIRDCYQGASSCCMCESERRKCDCSGNISFVYQDTRIKVDNALCIEDWITVDGTLLPDDRCQPTEPPPGP